MDAEEPDGGPSAERRVLTIPNLLSFLRLASVPVFLWMWSSAASGRRDGAVILYAIGAWSDFFDGYIARRTNSVTELGKLLDPLADRVFIIALAVALVIADVLPAWLTGVIVARDVLVLAAFPVLEKRGLPRIAVSRVGKTATAALLSGLTLLAFSETSVAGTDQGLFAGVILVGLTLMGVGAVLYWVAAVLYARDATRLWGTTKGAG
ncbi:MAG TPA: CDP-alcohol phosphatidyltransferase family protein [Actinomycetota bacterium]|nr:CDP-alcohol phosphatidyltransferase family protein [Actinomycetota bacterium]